MFEDLILDDAGLEKIAEAVAQAPRKKQYGIKPEFTPMPHQQKAFDRAWENGGRIILGHGTGTGKCLRGDTTVLTSRGLTTLSSLFPDKLEADGEHWLRPSGSPKVAALDADGRLTLAPVERLFYMRLKDDEHTLKFMLSSGVELDVTMDHPLPYITEAGSIGWRPARLWGPGDRMVIPENIGDLPLVCPAVPDALVELVAWQVAEGNEPIKYLPNRLTITQKDMAIIRRLVGLAESIGYHPHIRTPKGRCPLFELTSKGYRELLENAGYTWGKLSDGKAFPDAWVALPKSQLALLLSSFFQAEASVGRTDIELTSKSAKLLSQVQYMLLRFGIRGTVRRKRVRAVNGSGLYRMYWRLTLCGVAARRFRRCVGLQGDKAKALGRYFPEVDRAWSGRSIDVTLIRGELKSRGLTSAYTLPNGQRMGRRSNVMGKEFVGELGVSLINGPSYGKAGNSGTALSWSERSIACHSAHQQWAQATGNNLCKLAEGDVLCDKVVSIVEGDSGGYVYDIEVRDLHNFVAGFCGAIVHNTFSSIYIAEEALKRSGGPVIITVPDGLKTQFEQEGVERFTNRDAFVVRSGKDVSLLQKLQAKNKTPDYIIVGWSMLRRHAPVLRSLNPSTVMADEVQKMKDPNSENFNSFMTLRQGVPHCVLLTGSPTSNTPNDLLPLLSAVSDGEISPRGNLTEAVTEPGGVFEGVFGKKKTQRIVRDPDPINAVAGPWIDFVSTEDLGNALPPATTEYVPVEMSRSQWKLYQEKLEGVPPSLFQRIIRGISPPKREQSTAFTRVMTARQAAQSTQSAYGLTPKMLDTSPKVGKITDDLEQHLQADPRNRTVIYSNFIKGGVEAMHYALQQKGIPHSIFVGSGREIGDETINREMRDKGLQAFKDGKTRVLLLSGAGAEGLDLKDANMFQAMEGHFNPEVIRQAQARVRRMKGQQQFKPEERMVHIKRYVSVEPNPGFLGKIVRKIKGEPTRYNTTDEWVYNVAKAKHLTNEGVRISLAGKHPLEQGEDPSPERWLLSKPHKYISRVWDIERGKWKYDYPKEL